MLLETDVLGFPGDLNSITSYHNNAFKEGWIADTIQQVYAASWVVLIQFYILNWRTTSDVSSSFFLYYYFYLFIFFSCCLGI